MSHAQFSKSAKPCANSLSKCAAESTLRVLAGLAPNSVMQRGGHSKLLTQVSQKFTDYLCFKPFLYLTPEDFPFMREILCQCRSTVLELTSSTSQLLGWGDALQDDKPTSPRKLFLTSSQEPI